jgi:hypothetical protein
MDFSTAARSDPAESDFQFLLHDRDNILSAYVDEEVESWGNSSAELTGSQQLQNNLASMASALTKSDPFVLC